MFGADEIVVESFGFLARQRQQLLRARCQVADGHGAWLLGQRRQHHRQVGLPFPK